METTGRFFGASKKKFQDFKNRFLLKSERLTPKQKEAIEFLRRSDLNQRERLTNEIEFEVLNCMICCNFIGSKESVWICGSCHQILHFKCVVKWAKFSIQQSCWQCVACQTIHIQIPSEVVCFCGKIKDPKQKSGVLAHSCGRICGKPRECEHLCKSFCHPGRCYPCNEISNAFCHCGKELKITVCTERIFACQEICGKPLGCNNCKCAKVCHPLTCQPCQNPFCMKYKLKFKPFFELLTENPPSKKSPPPPIPREHSAPKTKYRPTSALKVVVLLGILLLLTYYFY
jgi:hypothetical protein